MHGGFTTTLVDCVSSYALMTHGSGVTGVSVDLHMTYVHLRCIHVPIVM